MQYCNQINKELEEVLLDLFVLEEGREFELTEDEFSKLAKKTIEDGEKEELSKSISRLKLGSN